MVLNEPAKTEETLEETKPGESGSKMLKHRTNSRKHNSRASNNSIPHEPLTPSSELSHRSARGSTTEKRPRKKKTDSTDDTTAPATPNVWSYLICLNS